MPQIVKFLAVDENVKNKKNTYLRITYLVSFCQANRSAVMTEILDNVHGPRIKARTLQMLNLLLSWVCMGKVETSHLDQSERA